MRFIDDSTDAPVTCDRCGALCGNMVYKRGDLHLCYWCEAYFQKDEEGTKE